MVDVVTLQEREQQCTSGTSRILIVLFTVTVFWASALLFLLEPMFAKMILPVFGGSPAVWNTSMVFFQSALFLGYVYSHYVSNRQAAQSLVIHSAAILFPLLVLPISIGSFTNLSTLVNHPAAAVLMIAAKSIGLPFLMVATSAPLLQRWFSQTVHQDASDPYFLYAASNGGSLIGLALYPCVIEPEFGIRQQSIFWSVGYVIFLVLTMACGLAAYHWRVPTTVAHAGDPSPAPDSREKLLWAALAFVPASLLYAFTAQLSTDFPPIPLLWVIPLGLYLLTFIAAFSTTPERLSRAGRLLPAVIVAAMVIFLMGAVGPGGWAAMGLLKLFCFAVIALAFHAEVARRRPGREHLTEYYLWVSAGGILGGLLNSFIAPVAFSDFWEFPLTLLLAAALLPTISAVRRRSVNLKLVGPAIALTCIAGIALQIAGPAISPFKRLLVLATGAILCMRVPPKWSVAALLLISLSVGRIEPPPLYRGRSFFGAYQVTTAAGGKWHILRHGTTVHGLQRVVDSPLRMMPRGYYLPVKSALELALSKKPAANIAAVGLGAGIVGCYTGPAQSTTFFEIDPLVKRIANRYFSFLSQCLGTKNVVLGDARLTLGDAAQHSFDVIVLDAFSSDTIPVHLLTKEAFRLYREKLTSDGLILVHLSNNYLDLAPVVAGPGAEPSHSTLLLADTPITPREASQGRLPSRWAVVLPSAMAPEFESHGWTPFSGHTVNWTDDHSSIFGVVMWQRLFGFDLVRSVKQP